MKQYIKNLSRLALCAALFSFSMVGGESFTIHLNDKLLVEQHLHSKSAIPGISLAQASSRDQLSVYFNECGRVGTGRKLALKDDKENMLKEWSFKNTNGQKTPMTFAVQDLQSFKGKGKLKLVYNSENAKDRVLATISFTDDVKARK